MCGIAPVKAALAPGSSFDITLDMPVNAVFGQAKNNGVAADLTTGIRPDKKWHLSGTVSKKGSVTIPFTINGSNFKLKFTVKTPKA